MKWLLTTVGCNLLEVALLQATAMDPDWKQKVALLDGKVIALEITDFTTTLLFLPSEQGLFVRPKTVSESDNNQKNEAMDVIIRGSIRGFFQLMEARRKGLQIIGGEVIFSGDVAVGQNFEQLLASLSPEWEESLSRLFGDPVSREIVDTSTRIKQGFQQIYEDVRANVQDYIQEEAALSPTKIEIENFAEDNAGLRADTARMEARIKRIKAQWFAEGEASL